MSLKSDDASSKLEVRLEKLEPMRLARFPAFGRNPEQQAWATLRKWADPQKLLQDTPGRPVFGFNNPGPSASGADYGYEFWIQLGSDAPRPVGVETIDFPGGWYAVLRHSGLPNPEVWQQLVAWVRQSPHQPRKDHELERPLNPLAPESELIFDLYLPIDLAASDQTGEIKVRGTDFLMYPVSNLANAAKFYRETLGLRQEMYSEQWQWAEFNCGNVTLALKGGETPGSAATGPRIALAVEDVHSAWKELKSRGVRTLGEPVDYGVCCAVEILDPDGNPIILHRRADGSFGQMS